MKKFILGLFIAISVLFSGYVIAKNYFRGETLSLSQVKAKWGNNPFSPEKFKNGDESVKASMAFNLIENKKSQIVGKDVVQLRQELGDFTGHYFLDAFPTYIIHSAKSKGEKTWQLVFSFDSNQKINDVFVHRNGSNPLNP